MSDSESVQRRDLGRRASLSTEIPSLLNTLKCPAPSILARKRHVHFNPLKGIKRGKGIVAAETLSVSPSTRMK